MEYHYTAVILKKSKVGETDRLYTFYTLEGGKVQAIGRGVRKPTAKLAGHLETLNRVSLTVVRGRGLGNIATAVTESYSLAVREHPEALGMTLGALRQFERLVEYGEKDEAVYELLAAYLSLAASSTGGGALSKIPQLTQAFLLQVLGRLGYGLELYRCVATGERLLPGERYYFSPGAGGVVRARAARLDSNQAEPAIPLSTDAIKLLRLFVSQPLAHLLKVTADLSVLGDTGRVVRAFIHWVM